MSETSKRPLRVALIGTARRAGYMYGPIIRGLEGEVELAGLWGRSEASASRLGQRLGTPWYTDLDKLIRQQKPDIGIVAVNYAANGEVGLMAVEAGLHVLLETPIAHRLQEADAIIAAAGKRNLLIEVAEQFHRRPREQIKLALIKSGVFGRVYSSFNDFAGHGYHGVSVMRSYLGFDNTPIQVTGSVGQYDLTPHWSMNAGKTGPRQETQEHGIIEFQDGGIGIFHWTNVGYDSALRWWRSSRFLAERGMGITIGDSTHGEERLSLLAPGAEAPAFITIERGLERCDGGALRFIKAHTGMIDLPIVTWENPLATGDKGENQQWHDDEIAVASCLMSLVTAVRTGSKPTYGAEQARLDQEIILAIRTSAADGGRPVTLPMDPSQQEV
jgi:predicted dehydrogenase